jgi:hypothetical protein
MESFPTHGTLAKTTLKRKVTDFEGNIRFDKGSGRYFGKIISALVLNLVS